MDKFTPQEAKQVTGMKINRTHFDGCSCMNNPPCSYCVDSCACEKCGDRVYADDVTETHEGFMCQLCLEDRCTYVEIINEQ